METRTQVAVMLPPSAVHKTTKSLSLQQGIHTSPDSIAMLDTAPVTPHATSTPENIAAKPTGSGIAASPCTAFSPRDPSLKIASPLLVSKMAASSASPALHTQRHQLSIQPPTPNASNHHFDDEGAASPSSESVEEDSVSSSPRSPKYMKANTGRWTEAEHKLFLKGLETFPYRAWKKIATLIKTRTVVQIRTHAQKYYQKLEKEEARMRDREQQLAQQGIGRNAEARTTRGSESLVSFSAATTPCPAVSTPLYDADSSNEDMETAYGKKSKHNMRKRKCSSLDVEDDESMMMPLPSLPKRMAREKKYPREKHMSPKQKVTVSSHQKFFGADYVTDVASASSSSNRASFGRGAVLAKNHLPLDFDDDAGSAVDDHSSGMILDFAEDKSVVEYLPFPLDGGMSSIDNDDLLQLTDEESLDWFSSTTNGDQDDDLLSAAVPLSDTSAVVGSNSDLSSLSVNSEPLFTSSSSTNEVENQLQFADVGCDAARSSCDASSPSSASSMMLLEPDEFAFGDDDDDFVLDPEKFLSSYLNPIATEC